MSGHVHFGDVKDHKEIEVTLKKDGSFSMNLGFLQEHHIYNVRLDLPIKIGDGESILGETNEPSITVESARSHVEEGHSVLSLNLKLDSIHGQSHFVAQLNHTEPPTVLAIKANILKSHEGTPSLKTGITIVARLDNDDSSSISSGVDNLVTA